MLTVRPCVIPQPLSSAIDTDRRTAFTSPRQSLVHEVRSRPQVGQDLVRHDVQGRDPVESDASLLVELAVRVGLVVLGAVGSVDHMRDTH